MTDTNTAPVGGDAAPVEPNIPAHTPAGDGELSANQAARSLIDWRRKRGASEAAPSAEETPAAETTPEIQDGTPPTEVPAEAKTEEAEPAQAEPPIDPPRSWTKDAKERWNSLPRETQEYLAQREQERDRELRRSQNESAEQKKTFEKERQAVTEARERYEGALPQLLKVLQGQLAGDFSDIKTMDDVTRLAQGDWPRYIQWDAAQKKIAAVQQEMKAAEERQIEERTTQWNEFAKREDSLFIEKVPEMADAAKARELGDNAVKVLVDLGFDEPELQKLWNGQASLSARDHRFQQLVLDAVKYRSSQVKAKTAAAKSVPPVQKPGVAQARASAADAQLQALKNKFDQTGNARDAAAYHAARRRAAS